jgi:hypothetical protein
MGQLQSFRRRGGLMSITSWAGHMAQLCYPGAVFSWQGGRASSCTAQHKSGYLTQRQVAAQVADAVNSQTNVLPQRNIHTACVLLSCSVQFFTFIVSAQFLQEAARFWKPRPCAQTFYPISRIWVLSPENHLPLS